MRYPQPNRVRHRYGRVTLDDLIALVDRELSETFWGGPAGVRGAGNVGDQIIELSTELVAHGHSAAAMEFVDRALQWYASRPASERESALYVETLVRADRWEEARTALGGLLPRTPAGWLVLEYRVAIAFKGLEGTIASHLGERDRAAENDAWLLNAHQRHPRGTGFTFGGLESRPH